MEKANKAIPSRTDKIYSEYKGGSTLLTDYQLCKAYLRENGCSLASVVEKILLEKYNQQWQVEKVRKAVMRTRGKHDPAVTIDEFNFSEKTSDILEKYVRRNFVRMVGEVKTNPLYPYSFRRIVEKHS